MGANRREFLRRIAASGLALSVNASPTAAAPARYKAVAFDAFPILDPRPVFGLLSQLFPERGGELGNLWRTKQFEYCWLRTLSRQYADFRQVTGDALSFATTALSVNITPEQHARLMDTYVNLRCWPEVPEALRSLKNAGIRVAFLSNMTSTMLEAGIRNSGLETLFDEVLSTDRVKAYKPDPRAYQMAVDRFRLKPAEILFAAFAGWDAAGAKAFGYPTYWVNRQNQPAEELGATPDGTGATLNDLVAFTRV
jgi:2-haloacid dehalogenase